MASCNPDPDSWVYNWIEWYLDEEGFPDPNKCGKERYFLTIDGAPRFADTREELIEKYPNICKIYNEVDDEWVIVPPKSFTFIAGTIFNNKALLRKAPEYLAELNALPEVERARLLHGNWKIRAQGSMYFQREWLRKADKVPLQAAVARGWDKAATEPSEVNREPDYTVSVKMYRDLNNEFYITGDYVPDGFDDKDPNIVGRFRKTAGKRDNIIKAQAEYDGGDCHVIFPQDPSAAGKIEFTESAKKLVTSGFQVHKDPKPTQMSKLQRFLPFASACENGLVHIVESTFTPQALLAFYSELEKFDGERSTRTKKDDWPDATATTYNYLCTCQILPSFKPISITKENEFRR